MKMLSILICLAVTAWSYGQGFSDKTNAIKLNYTQGVTATTLPSIEWISPRIERVNSVESSMEIEVQVSSTVPLKELRIEMTNGGETHSITIPSSTEMPVVIKRKIRLMDGENVLKLIALNEKGGQASSYRSVLTGRDNLMTAVDANRKDYALIIATDNYDSWTDLVNPVNDGQTIEKILKEQYGFITELVANPTLEEINNKLYDYNEKKFNPQDQLFIFVAGHGYFDETLGEGYLVASNSLLNDRGKTTYIPHLLLRERLNNIKCEHIFLAMDVCFGGTIDPKLQTVRGDEAMDEIADQNYIVKKLTKRTRKFLTSGSKEYVPDGVPGKHSPFAEKFVLALKEIGGGTGRVLSLLELQPYFLRLSTETRFGSFGSDDPASDFLFIAKQ